MEITEQNFESVCNEAISKKWPPLVAFAYQEFIECGPGVVMYSLTPNGEKTLDTHFNYATVEELDTDSPHYERLRSAIEIYDPARSVVIVTHIEGFPRSHFLHASANEKMISPVDSYNAGNAPKTTPATVKTELLERFVSEMWDVLAAASYEAFLEHGRGAIRLQITKEQTSRRRGQFNCVISGYGPQSDLSGWNEQAQARLSKMMNEYDPERHVLVIFCYPHPEQEGQTAVQFAGFGPDDNQLAPVDAYAARSEEEQPAVM